ncbi:MAG TPA: helix-turn-helix domain-containing protein [Thermoanaerobaculia bacterium]
MYGGILRHLREAKGRSQAEVAKAVAISPAHLARLEAGQRGLYVEDFVSIAEALGEKAGNLLPNDVGAMGHVKPIVDSLAAVPPELLPQIAAILAKVIALAEGAIIAPPPAVASRRESPPASRRKGRR